MGLLRAAVSQRAVTGCHNAVSASWVFGSERSAPANRCQTSSPINGAVRDGALTRTEGFKTRTVRITEMLTVFPRGFVG